MSGTPHPVRDRDVVFAAGLVVVGVIAFAWLTGLVPGLDDLIGLEPTIMVVLVVVTALVLIGALWRGRR